MGDDLQRQALARDLARRQQLASHDELRVVERVLLRLELGRERYGLLDLAGDQRDWRRERFEERLDALVYDVAEELVLEDRALAALREAARAEMLGPPDEFADQQLTRISGETARLADDERPYDSIEIFHDIDAGAGEGC